MERLSSTSSLRASLGLVTAVLSAVLLAYVVWQAVWLTGEAGATPAQISSEIVGTRYAMALYPLTVDLGRYRVRRQLIARVPYDPTSAIDREIADITELTVRHGADLNVTAQWNKVRKDWRFARTIKRIYRGRAIDRMISDVDDVYYNAEDASGLEYEPNKFSQDLGDLLFVRVPDVAGFALDASLLAQNVFARGAVTIPQRIRLARRAGELTTLDADFSSDDWDLMLANIDTGYLGSRGEAPDIKAHTDAYFKSGTALGTYVNNTVVMVDRPAGNPSRTSQLARGVVVAAQRVHDDVAAMLLRQLDARLRFAQARNLYLYLAVLFGAALMIGIMLIVAEITARRDRQLLLLAKQESERLAAELARQNAERALRLSEAQFRAVFDGAAMGIAVLDRGGAILDSNAVFRSVYGDNAGGVLEGHEAEFAELMRGERDLFEFEQHVMTPSGQEAWTDSTISLVNDETGNPYFAICMFRDLTELKRSERRMQHDLTHDALTGLPNRSLFEAKVREQFAEARTRPQASFALLYVDLDRFKDINESLGHEAGDFVISQVGHRLRASIEAADVVARLGSDEFAVLVRSLPDVLHVEVIARRVLTALAKPVALGSRSIFISASVGIALAGTGYQRGEDVMRDADIAMRYAKGGGGGRFAVFDSKMHARAEKRLQLTTDLRLALEHGEFDMLYQPIVRISDGDLVGCEALLRWNHPTEGVMLPMEFMPLAEQTALAVPIGRFVLRTTCQQLSRWKRAVGQNAPFPINVNVSAAELLDPEFETMLSGAVREFGVAPSDLILEITESVVLDAGTRPNALVERLRGAGYRICIDDFGTGYSSLRYLQQFKVDAIKIDRSFVSGQDGDVASEPIVRTLMTLAEAFDVRVVAEGIETPRQRDVLRTAGCRYGQGYFYAKALTAEQLAAMFPSHFGLEQHHAPA